MDSIEIRLECLRLAERQHGKAPDETVEAARKWADFVEGKRDADIIDAARTFAKAIYN